VSAPEERPEVAPDLPRGARHVCFDATPLIAYADSGHLTLLSTWFGPTAYVPAVVTEYELQKNLADYPQNQSIVDAPWLKPVPLIEPDDHQLANTLQQMWKSEKGRDRGEAELVALCKRYDWTAIVDDHNGRDGAYRNRVAHVFVATVLVAATAEQLITIDEAWTVHQAVEARYDRAPVLPTDDDYKPAFEKAVRALRGLMRDADEPPWPQILADPRCDGVVKRSVATRRHELEL
jgi:predicted nucleic acid-binding protein